MWLLRKYLQEPNYCLNNFAGQKIISSIKILKMNFHLYMVFDFQSQKLVKRAPDEPRIGSVVN